MQTLLLRVCVYNVVHESAYIKYIFSTINLYKRNNVTTDTIIIILNENMVWRRESAIICY